MIIRQVQFSDATAIAELYNWYIDNTIASFEEAPVSTDEIVSRPGRVDDSNPWLILEDEERLLGYAYAIPFKTRPSYRYTKESSVYIHKDYCRTDYGLKLLQSLIDEIRVMPIHRLIAGIALPNEASI
ncbi:MAG: GNAT family N-acetyltransferase [Gammaproteobacteria bacterium]|nr:GNAT family N-acetyltransferase [Gammaproteobacteria bacterium]